MKTKKNCSILAFFVALSLSLPAMAAEFISDAGDHYTYFSFSLSSDSALYMSVDVAEGTKGRIIPSIIDADQTIETYHDGAWKDTWWVETANGESRGPIPVKAGNYVLRVESIAYDYPTPDVKITMDAVESSVTDYGEYNGTFDAATPIPSGSKYNATIGYTGITDRVYGYMWPDKDYNDYFTFTPASDGSLTYTITFSDVYVEPGNDLSYVSTGLWKNNAYVSGSQALFVNAASSNMGPFEVTEGTTVIMGVSSEYNAYGSYTMEYAFSSDDAEPVDDTACSVTQWQVSQGTGQTGQGTDGTYLVGDTHRGVHRIESTEQFDLSDKKAYVKWQVDDRDAYGSFWVGAAELNAGYFTTQHSWNGSTVIESGLWYYTDMAFNSDHSYATSTCTGNYCDKDGTAFYATSGTMSETTISSVSNAGIYAGFNDVYTIDPRITVGEAFISGCETSGSDACKVTIEGVMVNGNRAVGEPVTFSVNASNTCGSDINYRFSVHGGYGTDRYDGRNWQLMTGSEYQTDNTCTHTFDEAGKYIVVVWAKNETTDANADVTLFGLSVDVDESGAVTETCKVDFNSLLVSGDLQVGSPVIFAVNAGNSCNNPVNYRFAFHDGYGTGRYDGRNWQLMTDSEYQTDHACSYTFDQADKYVVVVWAKNETTDANDGVSILGVTVDIEE